VGDLGRYCTTEYKRSFDCAGTCAPATLRMTVKIKRKSEGNYPTQANRGLEWGTRRSLRLVTLWRYCFRECAAVLRFAQDDTSSRIKSKSQIFPGGGH